MHFMGKNDLTIEQLKIACRHVDELVSAGVSENLAIRTLEVLTDTYAQTRTGGIPKVWSVNNIPHEQWSLAALQAKKRKPRAKPGTYLRVEHGTPRRDFSKMIKKLNTSERLTEQSLADLIKKYWRMAVLTHEEDSRLGKSKTFKTPQERWATAGIRFLKNSPNVVKRRT